MEMNTSIYTHTLREKKWVKDRDRTEAEQRTVELIEKVRKGSKNE